MKKPIKRDTLSEAWCELNCWRTPKFAKEKRIKFEKAEIGGAMKLIEALIPKTELLKYWQDQDMGRK